MFPIKLNNFFNITQLCTFLSAKLCRSKIERSGRERKVYLKKKSLCYSLSAHGVLLKTNTCETVTKDVNDIDMKVSSPNHPAVLLEH